VLIHSDGEFGHPCARMNSRLRRPSGVVGPNSFGPQVVHLPCARKNSRLQNLCVTGSARDSHHRRMACRQPLRLRGRWLRTRFVSSTPCESPAFPPPGSLAPHAICLINALRVASLSTSGVASPRCAWGPCSALRCPIPTLCVGPLLRPPVSYPHAVRGAPAPPSGVLLAYRIKHARCGQVCAFTVDLRCSNIESIPTSLISRSFLGPLFVHQKALASSNTSYYD
jgi:hypothetical protein